MRNENYEPGTPENGSPLAVSLTLDEAPFLKNLVEKLAHRRYDTGYCYEPMPSGWNAVNTSSIEAYLSGCMDIRGNDEIISLSFTTCFAFTCTKLAHGENTLSWVNSLS
ncbi:MAG: hypothetical protein Q8941_10345 [Bacteroidota bacterium]|nr:hypothetical protein [Bacteroidota bacterium]